MKNLYYGLMSGMFLCTMQALYGMEMKIQADVQAAASNTSTLTQQMKEAAYQLQQAAKNIPIQLTSQPKHPSPLVGVVRACTPVEQRRSPKPDSPFFLGESPTQVSSLIKTSLTPPIQRVLLGSSKTPPPLRSSPLRAHNLMAQVAKHKKGSRSAIVAASLLATLYVTSPVQASQTQTTSVDSETLVDAGIGGGRDSAFGM